MAAINSNGTGGGLASATTTQSYAITRDFTPLKGIPYPVTGDIETASVIKRAFLIIDSLLP